MAEEDEELLAMFIQEAGEHLGTIEPDLLTLEERGENTDPEIVNRLFRGIHSIKGSAGFFGLTNITKLSHTMENLMGRVRDRAIVPTTEVSDCLLAGLDKLKQMVENVVESEGIDAATEVSVIEAVLNGQSAPPPPAKPAAMSASPIALDDLMADEPVEEESEKAPETAPAAAPATEAALTRFSLEGYPQLVQEAVHHGRKFFTLRLSLAGGSPQEKEALYTNLKNMVESVGQVVATQPAIASGAQLAAANPPHLDLLICSVLDRDLLSTLLQMPGERFHRVEIPPAMIQVAAQQARQAALSDDAAPPAMAAAAQKAGLRKMNPVKPPAREEGTAKPSAPAAANGDGAAKNSSPTVEETLRVSVSLLDDLINNAGELVLARNQILRAAVGISSQFPQLGPLVQNLDVITSRIQEKVMQARMQPVSVVFNKFPRIIRDLARKLDKKIDLNLRGGDVELDKSVIEHLSDPLTHMIRNVADHAIETPAERLAKGKLETGQVELAAYHENGMVNISLSDDGAGIDPARIKQKALEKGILTEHQADTMSDHDALVLIFAPGFSTAKKVSDVSGRGVGMDVVRTNVEKLGGTVHVESKVGKGTRIVLKLPLTLAIIPAMIVASASLRFAIPEVGLVEIVRITESDRANQIEIVGNAPVLRLRNTLLPLVDLAEVLNLGRNWPPGSEQSDRRRNLADRRGPRRDDDGQLVEEDAKRHRERRGNNRNDRRDPEGLVAYVMVLNVGGNEFGMVVDEVLDSEEIVVKPLPSFFKDNPCFSATTILGDGSVALIIDYAGVMETAKVNFASAEKAAQMDLDDERRAALREKQNIILLETFTGAIMGIVHSMIRRVEKISPKLLEKIGGRPYVRYDRRTFRAIYPDQVLGVDGEGFSGATAAGEVENLCMVVPNIPGLQAGLIFARIIDTRETTIDLDTHAVSVNGLLGSTQIEDRVVLFPDIYAVFEMAGLEIPHTTNPADVSGLKALVVDDTPFLRAITINYLSAAGFKVDEADDGQMALGRLKRGRYDLLVTDLSMPGMDGFELASELHTTPNSDIPIIATTSSISSHLVERCSASGFANCVPIYDKTRLLGAIASLQQ